MSIVLWFLVCVAAGVATCFAILWFQARSLTRRIEGELEGYRAQAGQQIQELESQLARQRIELARLSKWAVVADADEKAREMLGHAEAAIAQAEADAAILRSNADRQYEELLGAARTEAAQTTAEARTKAKQLIDDRLATLGAASERSRQIIAEANQRAEEIAGKAIEAVRDAESFERTARAMKNIVEGYGDEYLRPAVSLLDDLAAEFGHKEAGQQLKLARDHTRDMITTRQAARSEYADPSRREDAERFVLDAFNGKVDSILSRVRHDNYGKLEQEIRDAFTIVNFGGRAFRDTRITHEYLSSRLAELKWAVVAQELKRQEQEEQRRIREQIKDEEKARREYEKAMRDAAKEQDLLRKAMEDAQSQVAAATAEQRAEYEAKLAELGDRLKEAEERNERAISMAQQTKRGHVYIVSNIGSFGEHVYKIGLTRRLDPLDRIRELSDASVPFGFDVHAVIFSDDAPALETKLHKHFLMSLVNKVNHRKEFFRANLTEIHGELTALGVDAKWTMVAEAREYRETLAIERAIQADPAARDAWVARQLTLEPVPHGELEAENDTGA